MGKRYDTMGFESEHGVYVRTADHEAELAEWKQMRNEAMEVATKNREEISIMREWQDRYKARIRELEAENYRLNMEMAAYRQGCTRADAEAMMAVKDALEAEKEARKERRHSTDTRCPNMMHKRYAMLNCTECSP
jgi:hypothetical protein